MDSEQIRISFRIQTLPNLTLGMMDCASKSGSPVSSNMSEMHLQTFRTRVVSILRSIKGTGYKTLLVLTFSDISLMVLAIIWNLSMASLILSVASSQFLRINFSTKSFFCSRPMAAAISLLSEDQKSDLYTLCLFWRIVRNGKNDWLYQIWWKRRV